MHCGGSALELVLITSGRSSSTTILPSKSQILMEGPVAAHSQYLLGEKIRALMMSPPSRVYRCLPSFRSQSMAWPSLPPEAHREPSGETVTQFRNSLWPKWLVFSLQLVRFHSLMVLS